MAIEINGGPETDLSILLRSLSVCVGIETLEDTISGNLTI